MNPPPIVLAGDVEGMIDPGPPGEIGGNRMPPARTHGFADRRADGAGGAGNQHDLVLEAAHAPSRNGGAPALKPGADARSGLIELRHQLSR